MAHAKVRGGSGKRSLAALEEQGAHVPGAQWARGLVVQEVTCFQILSEIFFCTKNFMWNSNTFPRPTHISQLLFREDP